MASLFDAYEVLAKSGLFDARYYLSAYPEVAAANLDPLLHYLEQGARQGRNPSAAFDSAFYSEQCAAAGERADIPLLHFIVRGGPRGLRPTRNTASAAAHASAVPQAHSIQFHCDEIVLSTSGHIAASGWLLPAAGIASLVIFVDGAALGSAQTGLARPDVAHEFGSMAGAEQAGFAFVGQAGPMLEGDHLVVFEVKTIDGNAQEFPFKIRATPAIPPPEPLAGERFKIYVDSPRIEGGAAALPIRGSLSVTGWALARGSVASIDIQIDGQKVAAAYVGMRRKDVEAAFPDWDGALTSGFGALVPHRALPPGRHLAAIAVGDKTGQTASSEFWIEVEQASDEEGPWSLKRKIGEAQVALYRQILAAQDWHPRFRLAMAIDGGSAIAEARKSFASLRRQAYSDWRLAVVPRVRVADHAALRRRLFIGFDDLLDRVDWEADDDRMLAAPAALDQDGAGAQFIGVIGAGDQWGCDALLEFAVTTGLRRDADFLYADERRSSPVTGLMDAFLKPQWSPDLLLSTNYIGRSWIASDALAARIGLRTSDLSSQGDYDVVLRCTENAKAVVHLPAILCERSDNPGLDPVAERTALANALSRRGIVAEIGDAAAEGTYRVKRPLPAALPRVSIIIPTCAAGGLVRTCIESLRTVTAYPNYEIVCIENIPKDKTSWKAWVRAKADRCIEIDEPFNWSRFNNRAAEEASGEYLLFLNDDTEIVEPSWLDALVEHAQRPEVGVVGAQLLYPDRRVQHAGIFLVSVGKGRHAFRFAAEDDPGYFGLALTQRNVIGVTGACLMTSRKNFDALGHFSEDHTIVNNDIDYCLKAWRAGLVNIFTPYARLVHHELASRGELGDVYDTASFDSEWRSLYLDGDPYFNPRLSKDADDFSPEAEPVELICAGRPICAKESIKRILIVKLDHIGDCVTALPAVESLHRHFPTAELFVLAAAATKPIWQGVSGITEFIDFEFFHRQSGAGTKDLTEEDLRALGRRLEPYGFDLAVDLRKHPATRDVLRHTGARYLAGFDFQARFPWLDIALEWEGDVPRTRKHASVGDDLLRLVDAIASACEHEPPAPTRPVGRLPKLAAKKGAALFDKRVIAIHPGSGTAIRQWPEAHFADLIDLLVERDDVHVALIGGAEEKSLAAAILKRVRRPDAVWNLMGALTLDQLPSLLAQCVLFVGNNSGPQHVAAALGIATIGVHSGQVDAREWGPVGAKAVALQRRMSCGPCYLERAEDCPRALACLTGLEPGEVYRTTRMMLGGKKFR